MEMTPERWRYTTDYLRQTFGAEDAHLQGLMAEARAAGLPDIAVSPDLGRLLMILTSTTRAGLAVEIGTLAGYSGIWIARGLSPSGRLITIEPNESHATFAETQFRKAGVADRVEIRRAPGIEALHALAAELAPGAVHVLFLDALKSEYPDYFAIARPLIAPGGLLLADNVLGSGSWWIDQEGHEAREGADTLNRTLAADPEFEAAAVPLREGLLIARRRD
jgi:caffeoyl-CoA O-methyltransferase